MMRGFLLVAGLAGASAVALSCGSRNGDLSDAGAPPAEGGIDVSPAPDAPLPSGAVFCAMPGSFVWTAQGVSVVPGAPSSTPDLHWLNLPAGFCAHYFGDVPTARQLRFAPDGDLFVASPSTPTTGGANDGINGIVILPDDDHDGFADSNITFLDQLPSTQGLMFAGGYLYYQDQAVIRRVPVRQGQRQPPNSTELMTTISVKQDTTHWTKVLDIAQDGAIYITNGGSQADVCDCTRPVLGSIFRLNMDGTTTEVAKGFRNPIALRCEADHNVCLVAELALDYSGDRGGREKILTLHEGDDWGYPCCATQDLPYANVTCQATGQIPDCSSTAPEDAAFVIGETPFGLDFETGRWPAPWGGRVFVTLHGEYATWRGARVVAIALDPATGLPLPSSELSDAAANDHMLDFATGWDDGKQDHGRPAPVTFAPDGRLFVGNDRDGEVVWIAPIDLASR